MVRGSGPLDPPTSAYFVVDRFYLHNLADPRRRAVLSQILLDAFLQAHGASITLGLERGSSPAITSPGGGALTMEYRAVARGLNTSQVKTEDQPEPVKPPPTVPPLELSTPPRPETQAPAPVLPMPKEERPGIIPEPVFGIPRGWSRG